MHLCLGRHVRPPRGKDGLPPRSPDGQPLENDFSGLDTGVQPDAIEPHSTTAVHNTSPALASPATRSSPLGTGPAEFLPSRAGTGVPASEIAVRDFSPGLRGPPDGQPFENVFSGLLAGGLPVAIQPPSAT